MKQISNMVIRLKGREKYFLSFSYAANVMVTCILIMIATGIQNITNESLSSSDAQQISTFQTQMKRCWGRYMIAYLWREREK